VYLSSAPETRVINNTVLSSGKNGIQISHSSYLLLEGNRISTIGGRSGGGHGIRLENSAFVVLRHNQIQNCLTDSLYLYNASHSVFQDLVLDNTTTGITLRGTDNATFDRITVQNNRVGMDISSSGSVLINRVFRSTFVSNTHHLISTDSAVEWNSTLPLPYRYEGWYQENYTGNYWDTYPYEDSDGDGIGDQAYVLSAADTDFYPLIVPFTAFEWDPDVTPPGTILNLTGYSPDPTTFCWNWQDPPDQDLDHLMVYLNGTFLLNLSAGEQTLTVDGLFPSTEYTLGIVTVDTSGNRNPDWINHTGTTCSLPDPSPSPTETVTPIPTDTEIPTVTIPPTSSHTASIPTSRAVTHRRNTRYIPPPSTYPPTTNTVSPAIEEEYPSLPSEADNTVSAPESTAVPGDIIPPWTVQIPASAVALPLLVVAVSGYLLRRKKK
jgi:parallel beta-helix repeat protein